MAAPTFLLYKFIFLEVNKIEDKFLLGGKEFTSRLMIGSGKLGDDSIIPRIIENSGAEIMTVALRRVNLDNPTDNILQHIPKHMTLLPNTSGARNSDEAVRIARLAQAAGMGDFVKIEIMQDSKYLLPDNYESAKATEILAKEGFIVLPYMLPDLTAARSMMNAGAAAIMPLGAPIGSNKGLQTKALIQILINEIDLPIIVDAGIGKPSDACEAMEMGASACLLNTAIATSGDPIQMASAFKNAIIAGRQAHLSGLGRVKDAEASSPLTGFLNK